MEGTARTVERHHDALARRRELRLSHRIFQIRDELVHHRHGQALRGHVHTPRSGYPTEPKWTHRAYRDSDVHRGRVGDGVQVPATLAHLVADLEHIQRRAFRGRERDDGRGRVPEHAQLRDFSADPVRNGLRRGHD